MGDIPPEIFGFLSMNERLRCRHVCRAWKQAVEQDLKELCLYVRGSWTADIWIIDCELIDRRSVLTIEHLSLLSDPNFGHTFRNLERLLIKYDPRKGRSPAAIEEFNFLKELANFQQLQHLELHGLVFIEGVESSGLQSVKKFLSTGFYRSTQPVPKHTLPTNLETAGFFLLPQDTVLNQLNDRLKVLIAHEYSDTFLRLTNLERLHLTFLMERDKKPSVFVGHFEKLLLLDIFRVNSDRYLTEVQEEVASLRPTRRVRFFHNCCEVSDGDQLKRLDFVDTIDLNPLLSVACQHPKQILAYHHFLTKFVYRESRADHLVRPLRFEFLKDFRNVKNLHIGTITSYKDLRNLLMALRHLLILSTHIADLECQFFDDLPAILKDLVHLAVSFGTKAIFENLHFLNGFQQLLAFRSRFEKNHENQETIEKIEQRRKGRRHPLLIQDFDLEGRQFECRNFLDIS